MAENLGTTLIEPMQKSTKEMENVRKQLVDDGTRLNKELQEAYTHMKKMKQAFEEAQSSSNEAALASQKAITQTHSKGAKTIEKATNKAQTAQDKAQLAYETFLHAESTSKAMQEKYYSIEYPELMTKFKQRELDRVTELHGMLMLYCDMMKRDAEDSLGSIESLEERVRIVDIDSDIKNFAEDHMQDNNVTDDSIAVTSLMNPQKTGRIKYKSNNNPFSVFMNDSPLCRKCPGLQCKKQVLCLDGP